MVGKERDIKSEIEHYKNSTNACCGNCSNYGTPCGYKVGDGGLCQLGGGSVRVQPDKWCLSWQRRTIW